MTELKIQIETGFETEQDLKKSLQQLEGILLINANYVQLWEYLRLSLSLSLSLSLCFLAFWCGVKIIVEVSCARIAEMGTILAFF